MSPLCESFLTRKQLGEPETYYPLHVRICDGCELPFEQISPRDRDLLACGLLEEALR
ncbi:MAG: hypothetical protein ACRD2L_20055 [Terriglobia bacterium]